MKKFIGKVIPIFLSVVLMIGTTVIGVSAESTGEFEYTVENDIATITQYIGNSENVVVPSVIDGYSVKTVTFEAFRGDNAKNIKTVVVSEGIENIGDWLFTSCQQMESITLPSTVKELATDWFFIGSQKLKELKFSGENSRYYLDDNGVLYDSHKKQLMLCPAQNNLKNGEYKILDGTTNIRGWAFLNCETLKKVIMPNSITTIEDHAFSGCNNIEEMILSDNISIIGYDALGFLDNLKEITIPKNVKGFYYNEQSTNTYLGYSGESKIDGFTIKGYRNSEAEKYAKDNGFKFISLDDQVDYSKYNPIEFLGMSYDEIIKLFGSDYTETEERESGLHKIICYPDTGNPFEFGFDDVTDKVIIVWIYDLTDKPINLFDDITNKSTLGDIEKSTTSYTYNKWVGENALDDNNIEQTITYKIRNNIIVNFLWTFNDFNEQPANRVLVMHGEVEGTTNSESTSIQGTTQANINPTASTDITSKISTKDTATSDSVNNDNGTIQTGAISIAVIIFLILASLATGGFVWYRRKIK